MAKNSWNLKLLLETATEKDIKKDLARVKRESYKFINKWKDRNDYLKSPKVLKQALDEYETWQCFTGTSGNAGYYIYLKYSQNQNDSKTRALLNKIEEVEITIQNDIQFFEHNISKISSTKQKKFLKAKLLSEYKHFLEKLFVRGKYLLSDKEEKIINLKYPTSFGNWKKLTESLLATEERKIWITSNKKATKSFDEVLSLTQDKDKRVRDSAADAFNEVLDKYKLVAEQEFNSVLQDKRTNDNLRGFGRPDQSRHISDDIDTKVVDTMTSAVSKNFKIAKDYYKLRAKLFGVKKLEYHERNVEYGKLTKKYSFEKGVRLIQDVMRDLDPVFGEIFENFVSGGNIDVYPAKGKKGGAFCISILKSQPVYILLNWTDKLRDVTTLAHELGHGINDELKRAQNALYFDTSLATAEVASTFMEDFVTERLLKEADDELRLSLLVSKLGDEIATIFRQVAFYNFELELHSEFRKKGYLSHVQIGKIFTKHMVSYMGPAVKQSPGSPNWWIYVGHFRRYFYVYSYASGLLISKYLQSQVRKDKAYINKVKEFLSAGTSDSPQNIFKNLSIDIADQKFWTRGITEVGDLLKETKKLAKNLGKI